MLDVLTYGCVILRFATWEFDHRRCRSILLVKCFWLQLSCKISHISLSKARSEPLKTFVTILWCGGIFVNLNGFNFDFNFIFIDCFASKNEKKCNFKCVYELYCTVLKSMLFWKNHSAGTTSFINFLKYIDLKQTGSLWEKV